MCKLMSQIIRARNKGIHKRSVAWNNWHAGWASFSLAQAGLVRGYQMPKTFSLFLVDRSVLSKLSSSVQLEVWEAVERKTYVCRETKVAATRSYVIAF